MSCTQSLSKKFLNLVTVSDVQFNIDMKKADKKFDEFDDDEENPLAKLPVVKRPKAPIQKVSFVGG